MIEQSDKCHEEHVSLKQKVDKICCTLFGCEDNPKYIPITTKVEIMFGILIFIASSSITMLGGVVMLSLKAGSQLNEIQNMNAALNNHIESSEKNLLDHEKRLIMIESKLTYKTINNKLQ